MWTIPKELYARGVVTASGELAFAYKDVLRIIDYLAHAPYPFMLLGGGMFDGDLQYAFNDWTFEPDPRQDSFTNRLESFEVAGEYIAAYARKNGEDCYCSLVIADRYTMEDDTKMALHKARVSSLEEWTLKNRLKARYASFKLKRQARREGRKPR